MTINVEMLSVLNSDETLLRWCIKQHSVQTSLNYRWTRPQLHTDWSTVTWPLFSLSLRGVSVRSFLTNQSPVGSKGSLVQNSPDKSLQTLVFERNTHTCECECLSLTHSTNGKRVDLVWIEDCSFTQHTQRENNSVPEQTIKTRVYRPVSVRCV